MPNDGIERWRDPKFAPRLSVGVEALIAALPTTYEEAIRVITATGLAESTAKERIVRRGLRAGYLRATGAEIAIRTSVKPVIGKRRHSYKHEDTRTLEYVHWPKEIDNEDR